jgi:uncharacterized protein DUF3237
VAVAARAGRADALALFTRRGFATDPDGDDAFFSALSRGDRAGALASVASEPGVAQRLESSQPRVVATLAGAGDTAQGHRRIVPLTGGTFTGPAINGKLLPGASADWQTVLPDGTALGDIRYTLQTDGGDVLYVQSRGVRHGSAEVLTRLGRGEDVDASEYTFRTSTQIETAAAELDWVNKGVFVSVGGRQASGVIYETYLVQ